MPLPLLILKFFSEMWEKCELTVVKMWYGNELFYGELYALF